MLANPVVRCSLAALMTATGTYYVLRTSEGCSEPPYRRG
jgi:hypothetical protein